MYDEKQIKTGAADAAKLLSITDPASLSYTPDIGGIAREARRLALTGLAVKLAFRHLYTNGGLAASQTDYDNSRKAMRRLTAYPLSQALEDFNVHWTDPALTITEKEPSRPAACSLALEYDSPWAYLRELRKAAVSKLADKNDPTALQALLKKGLPIEYKIYADPAAGGPKVIEARRIVVIDYIYGWMLQLAGDRSRDFRATCPQRTRLTASSQEIKDSLIYLLGVLEQLNNFSSPLVHSLVDKLLVHPPTGLPFNSFIPF